jgi:hypothetical protein
MKETKGRVMKFRETHVCRCYVECIFTDEECGVRETEEPCKCFTTKHSSWDKIVKANELKCEERGYDC